MTAALDKLISNARRRFPRKTALIESGRAVSYRELDEMVSSFADEMLKNGLRKGGRVGILARNSISSCAALFAVSRAGGVAVPLNHTLSPGDISYEVNDSGLSILYVGNGMEEKSPGAIKRLKAPGPIPKSLAMIIYTSGTTGRPLGVMLSHKGLISNAASVVKYAGIKSSNRILCVLPFHYIYGLSLVLSHMLVGGTIIIENRFLYPNCVLDAIDEYKATGFAGVSSHYAILLNNASLKRRRLPSLKYFMQAGDAMPVSITGELLRRFPSKKLFLMYGQTEAGPRLTYLDPAVVAKKPNSVGKAVPGVEIKIAGGEIAARGDSIMLGYWRNRAQTQKVLRGGWLHTGDMGYMDSDGYLYIVGRRGDLLKIGGNRVNPLEIEQAVMGMDGIAEASVIGVPNRILGNRLKLFVSLERPRKKIDKGSIIRFCRMRMPAYKVPGEVVMLKSIPKNDEGKIDREALKRL